ncbi:sugar phosphate isomerase/epimerase family protein [Salibacterium lacus]|uniref:Sugar phosphate isomerase/epimerase family protein n=1 Tax=Salibacterium lacus TaxID=1898109 RepID=A0ABW5T1K5_9BACI
MWGTPFRDIIKQAAKQGFEGVELWAEHIWAQEESVHDILRWTKDSRITCTLHAPSWDLNPASINKEIREASYQQICRSMELAEQVEAPNITVHPGHQTIPSTMASWHTDMIKEQLYRLNEKARRHGCTLSVEHMEEKPKELFCTPGDMNHLTESMPGDVKVTFDAAHVPAERDPADYFERMNRINKIHLSDTSQTVYHVGLGEGHLSLFHLMSLLEHTELPVVLEGFEEGAGAEKLASHLDYLKKFQKESIHSNDSFFITKGGPLT